MTDIEIGRRIAVSDKALYDALMLLYAQQTPREQAVGATWVKNNVGFDAVDAPFLSRVVWSWSNGVINYSDKVKTRIKIMKYLKQLSLLMEEKENVSLQKK